ncbi:transglutaminase, partial [Bacillus smithii]|nr:transglutaminase [Bacillus smithii]
MELIPESANLVDYLVELDVVNFSHPLIQKKRNELFYEGQSEIEKTKIAFEFVRDEISHSWESVKTLW